MKVVVAIDSLKGSLTSLEAGSAIREGVLRADPEAEVIVRPLADGGEGTVEALTIGMGGQLERVLVTGPLGRPVECAYGILPERGLGIVEMSGAAGITLVPETELNPMNATTYGVGEVIRDAIAKGCRHFLVGIGGSATNDGGIGMLQALGFGLLNENGAPVSFGAKGLEELRTITTDHVLPELRECTFRVACDVTNPLCGERGASAVYGPQKGASPADILQMDKWLAAYAELAKRYNSETNPEFPGAGAAGGLGFAFRTFLNAALDSGIKIVLEETHLADYVRDADVVVTGEGKMDAQTCMGKAPVGVANIAKQFGKPVVAFAGIVTPDAGAVNGSGIDAFFPILRTVVSRQEAMDGANAKRNMADTVEQVFRALKLHI